MKVFSAAQIRACDAYTIKAAGISSIDLMERAAKKCTDWIQDHYPRETLFVILCGTGNNGGDGFAIARLLHQAGYGVKAFLLQLSSELTPDCQANMQRLQNLNDDLAGVVKQDTFITDIPSHIVIVDAIFGTGLNRPIQGWVATFIDRINQLPNPKIAIDIPSGLPSDVVPDDDASVIHAQHTLSFQFHKRTFLHPESGVFTGKVHILDIGLDSTFINATHSLYQTLDRAAIKAIYHPRSPFSHKGTYGHALLIGGSAGKIGAVTLSTKAALRAGSGLVTALIPGAGYHTMQTSVPEAMCRIDSDQLIENIDCWQDMDAIGIGPGLGTATSTATAVANFIEEYNKPLVVDADALNIIAKQPDLLSKLPKNSIITPHPKEFMRLFGENTNSMIQVDHARIQAMRYNINIVLKNHHTAIITSEGDCWYNTTGNAGMATGGAGDVLTGIITGLLAQDYQPHEAALLGVYLHGLSGDIAAQKISQEALIAGDIIDYLGKAFLAVASHK